MVILVGTSKKMVEGVEIGKAIRKSDPVPVLKDVVQTSKEIEESLRRSWMNRNWKKNCGRSRRDIKKDSDESVSGLTRSPEFKPPQGKKEKPDKPKNP